MATRADLIATLQSRYGAEAVSVADPELVPGSVDVYASRVLAIDVSGTSAEPRQGVIWSRTVEGTEHAWASASLFRTGDMLALLDAYLVGGGTPWLRVIRVVHLDPTFKTALIEGAKAIGGSSTEVTLEQWVVARVGSSWVTREVVAAA
jgi:hypothetical protein